MKIYKYNGQSFQNEHDVRKAIWIVERKALPVLEASGDWLAHGVVVENSQTDAIHVANKIREKRNLLLSKTDFYLLPDSTIDAANLELVKRYRQELRDITDQEGFPENITFPKVPSILQGVVDV